MPTRLTEHLISSGLLSAEEVAPMLDAHGTAGTSMDTLLLERGLLSEPALLRAISEATGHRPIDLSEFDANREVASLIPPKIADRFGLVPLSVEGDALHVACGYPIPTRELQEISFLLNKRLELWVALEVRIRDWIRAIYGLPLNPRLASVLARMDSNKSVEAGKAASSFEEETTLEESLKRDLIDRLARCIIDEPTPVSAKTLIEPTLPQARMPVGFDRQAVPDWTLSQARSALKEASKDRDQILEVTLRFARRTFDFAAAFAVLRGTAIAWEIHGEKSDAETARRVAIPIDAPSVFRTAATTRRSYVGPVPADSLTRQFLAQLGRAPRTIFLFPVEVGGRLIAILYGDCAQRPMSRRRLSDFVLFCQDLPAAFQQLILRCRHDYAVLPSRSHSAGGKVVPEPIARVVWTTGIEGAEIPTPRRGPAPAQHLHASVHRRLPSDFAAILRRLTGPEPEQRSSALAELARFPQVSADKLVVHFPGPIAWSRVPVVDLPEAEELGPIPAALAKLGQPAARALAPLLDADNPDIRYFALLTSGSLPYPELVDGILRGLFAVEPEISSAARAAAAAFRRVSGFNRAIKHIRQELAATDSLRRALAARALGALHDRDSIDGLIGLTSSEDQLCAETSAEALRQITKASFGTNTRQWRMWWVENRERGRADWLVAALQHKDIDLRLSAIQELSKAFNDTLGYFADAPPQERQQAVGRWERLISERARAAKDWTSD